MKEWGILAKKTGYSYFTFFCEMIDCACKASTALNAMFADDILDLPDILWNYDARNYSNYFLRTSGEADTSWVMAHTAILHFCGRAKPWKPMYRYRFGVLYKHYMRLAER